MATSFSAAVVRSQRLRRSEVASAKIRFPDGVSLDLVGFGPARRMSQNLLRNWNVMGTNLFFPREKASMAS